MFNRNSDNNLCYVLSMNNFSNTYISKRFCWINKFFIIFFIIKNYEIEIQTMNKLNCYSYKNKSNLFIIQNG